MYLQVLAGETKRTVKPIMLIDDPDIIAAIAKLIAAKMGVELSAQMRMAVPPQS